MRKSDRTVLLTSSLITAAVIGLAVVQMVLIRRAYTTGLESFEKNVSSTLTSVVTKLEVMETYTYVAHVVMGNDDSLSVDYRIIRGDSAVGAKKPSRAAGGISASGDSTGAGLLRIEVIDTSDASFSAQRMDSLRAGSLPPDSSGSGTRKKLLLTFDNESGRASSTVSSSGTVPDSLLSMERKIMVEKVLDDISGADGLEADKRIDHSQLDSIVAVTTTENGIEGPYSYGIYSAERDSVLYASPPSAAAKLRGSAFRTRLFPHDIRGGREYFVMHFPGARRALLSEMGVFVLTVLLFVGAITFALLRLIRLSAKQREYSALLVDFINNMTHEFKTPISTISLAAENIESMAGDAGTERIRRYGGMISEETRRMKAQVQKILEMAALEEGEIELDLEREDLNALVREASGNLDLLAKKSGGSISLDLEDDPLEVMADRTHMVNVISELIENGIKYSHDRPCIRITVMPAGQNAAVEVRDEGIGLSEEDRKRVFDRYFRVPSGNIHNVRGFGLGLSYVRLIVEAHGGRVSASSAGDRGSLFRIEIPRSEGGRPTGRDGG